MQTLPRLLAIVALSVLVPACASTPKKSDCCSSSAKCSASSSQCQAPTAKKKAN